MSQTLASRAGNRALVGVCLLVGIGMPLIVGLQYLRVVQPKATLLVIAVLGPVIVPVVVLLVGATAAAVGSWYLLPKPWSRWIPFAVIALTAVGLAAVGLWYINFIVS